MPKIIPHSAWEVLGTDLFHLQGSDYLIVIDYFSKYIEITTMLEISNEATIKTLKVMFARYGIPKIIYSNKGTQYKSYRFKNFAKTWGFEHRTSSPRYPQSNGMPERHIQTFKSLLQKAEFDGKDPYLVLLEYRNTPISNKIASPSELFGRKVRRVMPIKGDFFSTNKYLEDRRKLLERQENQRKYYDRNAKSLKPLNEKDTVSIDEEKKGPKQQQ